MYTCTVHGYTCISNLTILSCKIIVFSFLFPLHPLPPSFFLPLPPFLSPSLSLPLPLSLPIPSISGTGQYLLTGTEDGSVELHRLSDPYSLAGLKEEGHGVWSLGVHDNHYGNISCISLTYDDKYLLTGAGDGNVFIYKTNLPANSPTSAPVKVSIVCVNFVVLFSFFMNLHVKPVTLHVHDPDIVCLLLLHRVLLVIKY